MIEKLRNQAHALKREAYVLLFAYRDPRVPWYAKAFLALVLAHTFSPIDLIPDFIPILGYLDDLVITPLGILVALRMIPPEVMVEARIKAEEKLQQGEPSLRAGAILVIAIWLFIIVAIIWAILHAK